MSEEDADREQAWELFTSMLPRMQKAGADLDNELGGSFAGTPLRGGEIGARVSPLVAALFTSHQQAADFLSGHKYCNAFRPPDSNGAPAWNYSPLTQLVWMWGYRIPSMMQKIIYKKDLLVDGVLEFDRFSRNLSNVNMAGISLAKGQGEPVLGKLTIFGIQTLSLSAQRDVIDIMSRSTDSNDTKVQSLYFGRMIGLIDLHLSGLMKALFKGCKKGVVMWEKQTGGTALDFAAKRGMINTVRTMLDAGVRESYQHHHSGKT